MESKKVPENINIKFEELDNKLACLQDLILKMKVDFNLIARDQNRSNAHTRIIKTTEDMLNSFLDHRPNNCQVITQCTTFVQKRVMKVLRVYSENGFYEANGLIKRYLDQISTYSENGICPDSNCIENAKLTLTNIRDFLLSSKENSISEFKKLLEREDEFELFEGNERDESKIMSVLGNENRLKILKELSKGRNYYTNLERTLGLKGGHFNFHLTQLKEAKFVVINETDKSYHITVKGLKALKMVIELAK